MAVTRSARGPLWIQPVSKHLAKSFTYHQFSASPGYPLLFFPLRERVLEASSTRVSILLTTLLKVTPLYRSSLRTWFKYHNPFHTLLQRNLTFRFYTLLQRKIPICLSNSKKNISKKSVAWWWWPLTSYGVVTKTYCFSRARNGVLALVPSRFRWFRTASRAGS